MARPIYSHEVLDADFQWLIQHYCEKNPGSFMIDSTCLPVVLVVGEGKEKVAAKAEEMSLNHNPDPSPDDPHREEP